MNHKECLLVLGMHRSGTSALCRVLVELGYQGPSDAILAARDNPYGYFESESVVFANDAILDFWELDLFNPAVSFLDSARVAKSRLCRMWVRRALAAAPKERAGRIVIKDPRISLFPNVWKKELSRIGLSVRSVLALRHPDRVARSLYDRNQLDPALSYALWIIYNARAILGCHDTSPVPVAYECLVGGAWDKVAWNRFLDSGVELRDVRKAVEKQIDVNLNRSVGDVELDNGSTLAVRLREWAIAFHEVIRRSESGEDHHLQAANETAGIMLSRVAECVDRLSYRPRKSYVLKASRRSLRKWRGAFWVLKKLRG